MSSRPDNSTVFEPPVVVPFQRTPPNAPLLCFVVVRRNTRATLFATPAFLVWFLRGRETVKPGGDPFPSKGGCFEVHCVNKRTA